MRHARRALGTLAVVGSAFGCSLVGAIGVAVFGASALGCAGTPPEPAVTSPDPAAHTEFPPATSGSPTHASSAASATSSSPPHPTPVRFTVVEGTPHTLPDGTTISAGKITYAHLKGDKNLSRCEVTVTHGGVTETKILEREGTMTFTDVAGLRVGLDGVNPYQQPSSAFLVVEE